MLTRALRRDRGSGPCSAASAKAIEDAIPRPGPTSLTVEADNVNEIKKNHTGYKKRTEPFAP